MEASAGSASKDAPPTAETTEHRARRAISILYHVTIHAHPQHSAYAAANALLQGCFYDRDSFAALTSGDPTGLESFANAFAPFDLALIPREEAYPNIRDVSSASAFLCRNGQHWFGLRRFGAHWINLNHTMQRPAQLVSEHIGICIKQLEDDGHEVFALFGQLPPSPADNDPLFATYFEWGLVGGLFPSSMVITDDEDMDDTVNPGCSSGPWPVEGEDYNPMLAESAEDVYQDDLQAAIMASLLDQEQGASAETSTVLAGGASRHSGARTPMPYFDVGGASSSASLAAPPSKIWRDVSQPASSCLSKHAADRNYEEDPLGIADFDESEDAEELAAAIAASLKESGPSSRTEDTADTSCSSSTGEVPAACVYDPGSSSCSGSGITPSSPISDAPSRPDAKAAPFVPSKLPWSKKLPPARADCEQSP